MERVKWTVAAGMWMALAGLAAAQTQGTPHWPQVPPQSTQQYFAIFQPDHPDLMLDDEIAVVDGKGRGWGCEIAEVVAGATKATTTTLGQGLTVAAMGADSCTPGWQTSNPVRLRLWRPSVQQLYELVPSTPPASGMKFANLSIDFITDFTLSKLSLEADVVEAPLAGGASVQFTLNAGPASAGDTYLLMGSMSGTDPGLPVGAALLPLNVPDPWFGFTLMNAGTAVLPGSLGVLDAAGRGTAALVLPPLNDPWLAGLQVHHAFMAFDLTSGSLVPTMASNAVPLTLSP